MARFSASRLNIGEGDNLLLSLAPQPESDEESSDTNDDIRDDLVQIAEYVSESGIDM